ncbi:MAG: NAD-dependent epimerase/dehydratase family protein, partial [Clostridia bacterium]|nr:NAD-dependent epimerase/dehydratase family protein [Clostridia bacterium]
MRNKTILVTGAAGFIGAALVRELLKTASPLRIIGFDNCSDYYDVSLKEYRLGVIEKLAREYPESSWTFVRGDLADKSAVDRVFAENGFDIVVNLAAQAGVRYSIDHPDVYVNSNIIGFYNILEACRHSYDGGRKGVEHLVYASS